MFSSPLQYLMGVSPIPSEGNDDPGRSVSPELLPLAVEQRERFLRELRRLLRIMHGNVLRSPCRHGLEVLRAHDGPRPSASGKLCPSQEMQAMGAFSPAGPMFRALIRLSPRSSFMSSPVSMVSFPHRNAASRISAPPS